MDIDSQIQECLQQLEAKKDLRKKTKGEQKMNEKKMAKLRVVQTANMNADVGKCCFIPSDHILETLSAHKMSNCDNDASDESKEGYCPFHHYATTHTKLSFFMTIIGKMFYKNDFIYE